MFSHRDDRSNHITRSSSLPATAVLYLGAEVFVSALIGFLLATLALVRRLLPRPPRDLKNDTVVITGAGSGLGNAVAEEFSKAGCIVVCIDQNLNSDQESGSDFLSQYQRIEELEPQNDLYQISTQRKIFAYKCNSTIRSDIIAVAKKIHKDIGCVDVLITCARDSTEHILDTVSTNLMSHYWTMLAFIPTMINRKRSHVVAVLPVTSTEDAYMGSKAAIAGLIEAIGQQFTNANQLTFTTVAPQVEPRLMKQSEQETARDIVQAVRRDQRSLATSWASNILYPVCCRIYKAVTSITEWLYRPGCDDLS